MFIVYKHTNVLNNKAYIGFTKHSIEERWNQHCTDSSRGSMFAFHKAIRKYGHESFKHEILEQCDSLENGMKREAFWIKQEKSLITENGYNMREGGSGPYAWTDDMKEMHRQKTSEGTKRAFKNPEIKERHKIATKIARNTPEARKRNSEAQRLNNKVNPEINKKRSLTTKKTWSNPELPALKRISKPVQQLDMNGNIIFQYRSAHHAARELNLSQGSISNVARGRTKTAGGFIWKYI